MPKTISKTLDLTLKPELINAREALFIPYKKNSTNIKNIARIIKVAPKQFKTFSKALDKSFKSAPEEYPVIFTKEDVKWGLAEDNYSKKLTEIRTYFLDYLATALTNFELQVIRTLKAATPTIKLALSHIQEKRKSQYIVVKVDLTAINDIINYLRDNAEQFEEESEAFVNRGLVLTRQTPIKFPSGRKIEPDFIETKKVHKEYKDFLRGSIKVLTRLDAYTTNIINLLGMLDKQTAKLIKQLP